MSLVNQAAIVLVFGAIGWGGGLAATGSRLGAACGALVGLIAALAFCDWLRSRFRSAD